MSKRNRSKLSTFDENTVANKTIRIKTIGDEQRAVIDLIKKSRITFIHGCAGTGKTWLATLFGLKEFMERKYKRLIFTRPCVEANGEKLGMLPGTADDKIAPYMIPIFDIITQKITLKELKKYIEDGSIKTLPLAFMRGVSFLDSYVIFDEAQNSLISQMRMFLTRIGSNSSLVVTGDVNQSDIDGKNGLSDAIERFKNVRDIGIIGLSEKSIVRDPIIEVVEAKYNNKN